MPQYSFNAAEVEPSTGFDLIPSGDYVAVINDAELKDNKAGNGKYISFEFPSSLRDLKNKKINNTYGDAVFMITLDKKEGSNTKSITPNDKPTIKMSRTTNQ